MRKDMLVVIGTCTAWFGFDAEIIGIYSCLLIIFCFLEFMMGLLFLSHCLLSGLDRCRLWPRPPTPAPCRSAATAAVAVAATALGPANTATTIVTNGAAGVAVAVGVRAAGNTRMTIVTNSAAGVVARRTVSRIATTGLIGIDRLRGPGIVSMTSCRQRMGIKMPPAALVVAVANTVGSRGSFQGYMYA